MGPSLTWGWQVDKVYVIVLPRVISGVVGARGACLAAVTPPQPPHRHTMWRVLLLSPGSSPPYLLQTKALQTFVEDITFGNFHRDVFNESTLILSSVTFSSCNSLHYDKQPKYNRVQIHCCFIKKVLIKSLEVDV